MRNVFQLVGGIMIGLSIPTITNPLLNEYYIIVGIGLILISAYFKFFYRTEEEKRFNEVV